MKTKNNEILIGIIMFIILSIIIFFCLKNKINLMKNNHTYRISAYFDNVGGLKVRSPVKIGGVIIGRVVDITLDPESYIPKVTMNIKSNYYTIPNTSSLSIRTSGLLGEQYLALNIGFNNPETGTFNLKDGDIIHDTKSAIILEDIVGHFLYYTH